MAHRVSSRAAADLDEIWQYVAEESGDPRTAQRLVDTITDRFYLLSEYPYLGRSRPDLRPGLRSHTIRNYLIFYRVTEDDDVAIVRVLRGSRDFAAIFRDS